MPSRRRRLIFNDDADQAGPARNYPYEITDIPSFLDVRTTPTFDTHVDTYVWCVGNGTEPPFGVLGAEAWPWLGSFDHATDIVINACREHGQEVWGSLRMNDLHDSFQADSLEGTNDPLKAQKPEYLIARENKRLPQGVRDRFMWTAFDFSHSEVRDHRLAFIQKNAEAHDFDGYELDFSRFPWYFPLGEGRKRAHLMTDLVRKARQTLDQIADRRGRPYPLIIHALDSPEISLEIGIDVEALLQEKLIDVLIVGLGYIHCSGKESEWLALGSRYGVPVYPSINAAVYLKKYVKLPEGQPPVAALARGTASYWYKLGFEGIYLFNLFVWEDKGIGGYTRDDVRNCLCELGDRQTISKREKLYSIQASVDRASISHGSERAWLPIALDASEFELPLRVGEDALDRSARFQLRVLLKKPAAENEHIWMRINHLLLASKNEGRWWTAVVPVDALLCGENRVSLWSSSELTQTDEPVIVERVFLEVMYG